MDDADRQRALMSALTAEHFVLQSAASATIAEAGSRTSLYVYTLSSSLVAVGFSLQTRDLFWPLIAAILPTLFVLGLFTIVRLLETSVENQQLLVAIARIREHYRTISKEAKILFDADHGRWPESNRTSVVRFARPIAFCTTAASMIACINSIVAGAGVALLAYRIDDQRLGMAWSAGVGLAVVLFALFYFAQRWFFAKSQAPGAPE